MKKLNFESSFAEDFFNISADYVGLWDYAVTQQLERLQNPTNPNGRTADFFLLVISLRNLGLALRRYRDELSRGIGSGKGSGHRRRGAKLADQALEIFEGRVPHIREMRDIFSHLEEYAFGAGRLQRSGAPLIVRCRSDKIVVVRDPNVQFELDLNTVKLAMEEVRACLIGIIVYYER